MYGWNVIENDTSKDHYMKVNTNFMNFKEGANFGMNFN